MTEKEYWLYLAKIKGLGPGRRRVLLEIFGNPEGIYKAGEITLRKIPLLEDYHIEQILSLRNIDYEKELESFSSMGIRFITSIDKDFPVRLKEIPDAPSFLFCKGELPDDNSPSVAIVGSRKCSIYGRETCLKFAEKLAGAGIVIISGMAAGVDGFAHRGAISAGGKTIAVLGCGVDICYPSANRDIYDTLSKGNVLVRSAPGGQSSLPGHGCIISEYYPGEQALPYNFPQRNRIISGLCDILLVVEAGKKSGTFITVDHALEQGREIFAIPGRIGDPVSDGCNSLIKNGATIATEPEDIIDELKQHYEMLLIHEKRKKKDTVSKLEGDERKVFDCLEVVPLQINEISSRSGIDCGELSKILISLELKGMVAEVGKNLYIRK